MRQRCSKHQAHAGRKVPQPDAAQVAQESHHHHRAQDDLEDISDAQPTPALYRSRHRLRYITGLFIRRTQTRNRVSGEPYVAYRLVHSARVGSAVKQTTLLHLGSHFDLPPLHWRALAQRIDELVREQHSMLDAALPETVQVFAQRFAAQLIARQSPVPSLGLAAAPALGAPAAPAAAPCAVADAPACKAASAQVSAAKPGGELALVGDNYLGPGRAH